MAKTKAIKKRLTESQKAEIIHLATTTAASPSMIAPKYGVSRQAVWLVLRGAGIDTSHEGNCKPIACETCGKLDELPRCRRRRADHHYCSPACYHIGIATSAHTANRQGQRSARDLVSEVYPLAPANVVYHLDGNTANNDQGNLMVFRNLLDKMRWEQIGGSASGVSPLLWPGLRTTAPKRVRAKAVQVGC